MTPCVPRFFIAGCLLMAPAAFAAVHQGNGIKIGEVTADSAVIWTRLTTAPDANWTGVPFVEPSIDGKREGLRTATDVARASGMSEALAKAEKEAKKDPTAVTQAQLRDIVLAADWRSQIPAGRALAEMHGTLPGANGTVRVSLTPSGEGSPVETTWTIVDPRQDYTRQFKLASLKPGTTYRVRVESRDDQGKSGQVVTGQFRTAPAANVSAPVKFGVVTCGDYPRRDDPANGHRIYDSLHRMKLDFAVHTGDVEYYDKPDPWATSAELARVKWNRLFALPFQRTFHNSTPTYFTNDDHDILKNDCWPGQTYGSLTWEQGIGIFHEQTPSSPLPYRTFRHGRDLQIWVIEGRRHRSANTDPDGPAKTILGAEQKAWLRRTIAESSATFKVLLTPTPIVGPDRGRKNDNHANIGFKHEGDELRRFLGAQKNLVVACGDRHWQYYSVDPETGTREFGCGPSSDVHAGGYVQSPGDEVMQKFFRLKGGFLTMAVESGGSGVQMIVRHHAVDGAVTHEATLDASGKMQTRAGR
jgi:alkaline phosphatase D